MYYAKHDYERDGRPHTRIYKFGTRRARDLVVAALEGVERVASREAYRAIAADHDVLDMTVGACWEDEFAPLFGPALRAGNFGAR